MTGYELRPVEHYQVRWNGVTLAEFTARAKAEEFIELAKRQDELYEGKCCRGKIALAEPS